MTQFPKADGAAVLAPNRLRGNGVHIINNDGVAPVDAILNKFHNWWENVLFRSCELPLSRCPASPAARISATMAQQPFLPNWSRAPSPWPRGEAWLPWFQMAARSPQSGKPAGHRPLGPVATSFSTPGPSIQSKVKRNPLLDAKVTSLPAAGRTL